MSKVVLGVWQARGLIQKVVVSDKIIWSMSLSPWNLSPLPFHTTCRWLEVWENGNDLHGALACYMAQFTR